MYILKKIMVKKAIIMEFIFQILVKLKKILFKNKSMESN